MNSIGQGPYNLLPEGIGAGGAGGAERRAELIGRSLKVTVVGVRDPQGFSALKPSGAIAAGVAAAGLREQSELRNCACHGQAQVLGVHRVKTKPAARAAVLTGCQNAGKPTCGVAHVDR